LKSWHKMVIVTQRVVHIEARNETADSLDQQLVDLLLSVGILPVPVSNRLVVRSRLEDWLNHVRPRGIVLSGGNDIGESPDRDQTELLLIAHARAHSLPLLGICRGMQMLGSWAGTGLKPVQNHVGQRHTLRGQIRGCVNSYHNFALSSCPREFAVLAQSEDGEIEAIRHEQLPWEGWMWHPEREPEARDVDLIRLQGLFCE